MNNSPKAKMIDYLTSSGKDLMRLAGDINGESDPGNQLTNALVLLRHAAQDDGLDFDKALARSESWYKEDVNL